MRPQSRCALKPFRLSIDVYSPEMQISDVDADVETVVGKILAVWEFEGSLMEESLVERELIGGIEDLRACVHKLSSEASPELAVKIERAIMSSLCVAMGDLSRLMIFVIRRSTAIAGFAVLVAETSWLIYAVGPWQIGRSRIQRVRVVGEDALLFNRGFENANEVAQLLLRVLCAATKQPILLQWAPKDGIMEKIATVAAASGTHLVQDDRDYNTHYWIESSEEFDNYIAGLSASSRQTFRYSVRKLKKDMHDAVRLRSFAAAEEIDEFMADATTISRETYQWKDLALGLKNSDAIRKRLLTNAALGYLKSYILYCRERPVAFVEGFQAGGKFVFYQIGYLPEYSKYSVGTVAILDALRDLMDSANCPSIYDFMHGEADYKRRMSNRSSEEKDFYLLPRSFKWRAISAVLATLGRLTRAGLAIKKLAIPRKLKPG